jgi:glutamate--cysteine ligase
VSRDSEHKETPIESKTDLVAYFEEGITARDKRVVGTEHEKFGLVTSSLAPLPFGGEAGVERVLERLAEKYKLEPGTEAGRTLGLEDPSGASISVEPGGQLELSGRVTRTIHETAEELDTHLKRLEEVSSDLDITWIGAGCRPFAHPTDIPWVPRARYRTMSPFLGARGQLAHHMMKATCTVQANFDYTSEADAGEILNLSARLSPLVSAIFANSPIVAGETTDFRSFRCHIWTQTDPDRCGTPDLYLTGRPTFEQMVDYLLDIPILFLRRDGRFLETTNLCFRAFLDRGFEGHQPTLGDWELHMSSVFPDIRMKQYIEVRGADMGDRDSVLALPALWKGILYDDDAREAASRLIGPMSPGEQQQHYADVCRQALDAVWRGRSVADLAADLLGIAETGLNRQVDGADTEAVFLAPLWARVSRRRTAADDALDVWRSTSGDHRALTELLSLF